MRRRQHGSEEPILKLREKAESSNPEPKYDICAVMQSSIRKQMEMGVHMGMEIEMEMKLHMTGSGEEVVCRYRHNCIQR